MRSILILLLFAPLAHAATDPTINYATDPLPVGEGAPWTLVCQVPMLEPREVAASDEEPISPVGEAGVWELSEGRIYLQQRGEVCGAVER